MDKINNKKGFTLLEIVVAMGIFTVTMLVCTQIFQMILRGQQNTISSQNIQENFRYALEVMSKEMRDAQYPVDTCFNNGPDDNFNTFSACMENSDNPVGGARKGVGLGRRLIFRNKHGECVRYRLDSATGQILITRKIEGLYEKELPITPSNIKVTSFQVFVDDNDPDADPDIFAQPTATLNLTAEIITNRANDKNIVNLQTSIVARAYNRY
jgi:prepilin-type N-terminal cleavage/methylation domain-containing protein